MERRLAAVLIADVVGYDRLSQIDEEGTRARFQVDLKEVFEPIAEHHGRLVKTMGDGLLVEFHSVVDALRCAVEVQQQKADRHLPQSVRNARAAERVSIDLPLEQVRIFGGQMMLPEWPRVSSAVSKCRGLAHRPLSVTTTVKASRWVGMRKLTAAPSQSHASELLGSQQGFDLVLHDVASAQLAIDGEIEQSSITHWADPPSILVGKFEDVFSSQV